MALTQGNMRHLLQVKVCPTSNCTSHGYAPLVSWKCIERFKSESKCVECSRPLITLEEIDPEVSESYGRKALQKPKRLRFCVRCPLRDVRIAYSWSGKLTGAFSYSGKITCSSGRACRSQLVEFWEVIDRHVWGRPLAESRSKNKSGLLGKRTRVEEDPKDDRPPLKRVMSIPTGPRAMVGGYIGEQRISSEKIASSGQNEVRKDLQTTVGVGAPEQTQDWTTDRRSLVADHRENSIASSMSPLAAQRKAFVTSSTPLLIDQRKKTAELSEPSNLMQNDNLIDKSKSPSVQSNLSPRIVASSPSVQYDRSSTIATNAPPVIGQRRNPIISLRPQSTPEMSVPISTERDCKAWTKLNDDRRVSNETGPLVIEDGPVHIAGYVKTASTGPLDDQTREDGVGSSLSAVKTGCATNLPETGAGTAAIQYTENAVNVSAGEAVGAHIAGTGGHRADEAEIYQPQKSGKQLEASFEVHVQIDEPQILETTNQGAQVIQSPHNIISVHQDSATITQQDDRISMESAEDILCTDIPSTIETNPIDDTKRTVTDLSKESAEQLELSLSKKPEINDENGPPRPEIIEFNDLIPEPCRKEIVGWPELWEDEWGLYHFKEEWPR